MDAPTRKGPRRHIYRELYPVVSKVGSGSLLRYGGEQAYMSKRSAGHGCRVCGDRDGRRSRVLSRSDVSGTVWFDVTLRVPQYLH